MSVQMGCISILFIHKMFISIELIILELQRKKNRNLILAQSDILRICL